MPTNQKKFNVRNEIYLWKYSLVWIRAPESQQVESEEVQKSDHEFYILLLVKI